MNIKIRNVNASGYCLRGLVPAATTRLVILAFLFAVSACVNQSIPTSPGTAVEDRSSSATTHSPGKSPSNRATEQLMVDAQRQFQLNDWQAAIAIAERGLRVDRRDVQLYLLISKSYRALGDLDLSKQFAEQGLRYVSEPTSDIALEFNRLLTVSF